MKKGLLLVVVMLATIAVKAQDIYVGGSLNVWRNIQATLLLLKLLRKSDITLMKHGRWVLNWTIHTIMMEE